MFSGRPDPNFLGAYLSVVSAIGCFWMTDDESMDDDGVLVNAEEPLDSGLAPVDVGTTGGDVVGGIVENVFLSKGLTRSNCGANVRLVSNLESASLKTTDELLYAEDETFLSMVVMDSAALDDSIENADVVRPVTELMVLAPDVDSAIVGMVDDDDGIIGWAATLPTRALESLVARPRFLLANSYMSPNIPAKVFLRFFMVSSASSATEDWDCVAGRAG